MAEQDYGAMLDMFELQAQRHGIVNRRVSSGLWPLLAEGPRPADDIGRLNHLGTHPVHVHLAIRDAIAYLRALGPTRKQARLRYLQEYWTTQVRDVPGIVLNTPAQPERACAIANVGIEGVAPGELAEWLLREHRVWTVAIDQPGVHGCRITPNIYTTTAELDVLIAALLARAGA